MSRDEQRIKRINMAKDIDSPLDFIREQAKQGSEDGTLNGCRVLCCYCGGYEPADSENLTLVLLHFPLPEFDWVPEKMCDDTRVALAVGHAHHFPVTHEWNNDVYTPDPRSAAHYLSGGKTGM